MHVFKDRMGRDWSIALTTDVIARVRGEIGVDLLDVDGGKLFEELTDDLVKLVTVLASICKPQYEGGGLTAAQFGEGLTGDAFDSAAEALFAEICDFFPSGKREAMQKAIAKLRNLQAAISRRIEKHIEDNRLETAILTQLDARLEAMLNSTPGA